MSDTVRTVVERSDLAEYSIYSGDCVNIAVALQAVFGGEFVASYANQMDFREKRPAHVAVRIGDGLFDGGGETGEEALRDRAYYGVRGQDHDEIAVCKIETPSEELHDPHRVNHIRSLFERKRTEM